MLVTGRFTVKRLAGGQGFRVFCLSCPHYVNCAREGDAERAFLGSSHVLQCRFCDRCFSYPVESVESHFRALDCPHCRCEATVKFKPFPRVSVRASGLTGHGKGSR